MKKVKNLFKKKKVNIKIKIWMIALKMIMRKS